MSNGAFRSLHTSTTAPTITSFLSQLYFGPPKMFKSVSSIRVICIRAGLKSFLSQSKDDQGSKNDLFDLGHYDFFTDKCPFDAYAINFKSCVICS